MNCEKIKDHLVDYLTGEIDERCRRSIQTHITRCLSCRTELENLNETWTRLGVLPEPQPDPSLKSRFYTMLESYKDGMEAEKIQKKKRGILRPVLDIILAPRPALRWAPAVLFILLGFTIAHLMPSLNSKNREFQILRGEVKKMHQTVAVSLMEKSSPAERLQAIHHTSRLKNPDQKILTLLLDTLNNDPSINVRLSAVDALYLFSDNPMVKEGLIHSINNQRSPMVQVALMELLVEIREKRAIRSLNKLLDNQDTEPEVKKQAQRSIKELKI